MYWSCESSSSKEDCKFGHNLIEGGILRSGAFETLSSAEGVLKLSWREVERGFAYLFCLYAREQFRWARHNKINMINFDSKLLELFIIC